MSEPMPEDLPVEEQLRRAKELLEAKTKLIASLEREIADLRRQRRERE